MAINDVPFNYLIGKVTIAHTFTFPKNTSRTAKPKHMSNKTFTW